MGVLKARGIEATMAIDLARGNRGAAHEEVRGEAYFSPEVMPCESARRCSRTHD